MTSKENNLTTPSKLKKTIKIHDTLSKGGCSTDLHKSHLHHVDVTLWIDDHPQDDPQTTHNVIDNIVIRILPSHLVHLI